MRQCPTATLVRNHGSNKRVTRSVGHNQLHSGRQLPAAFDGVYLQKSVNLTQPRQLTFDVPYSLIFRRYLGSDNRMEADSFFRFLVHL